MDARRWQRIEELFHAALERPLGEREAFVREACGGDDALLREVMRLVEADESPHSLLDRRGIDVLDDAPPPALAAGTRIGAYRVIRSVGSGGMGVVYLAERADGQFEQQVALKVIKRGMDSNSILSRFRSEQRILARLQHPHIARLLDGGVTDDGLPYFTMEYVDGRTITQYCDDERVSIEGRLDLFQDVCAAVQYAHASLVVHRDLKPSNILVTRDRQVKLLDFGIARVMGEDEAGITRSGQRVMTPAYASPEQVRGEPVTTASDVYSLGVILYELLCGRHPHRDTASTPVELEHAISTAPAEKPSKFSARTTDIAGAAVTSVDEIARARSLTPAKLRRRLEGDLDTICLTALRKEPDRRYPSATRLQDDVRAHLAGRPLSARPDTLRYRTAKFVGRNRAAVTASAALVVLVVALTVVYTTRLARERDRARSEARKAAEVSAFLTSLFESADPYQSRGKSLTAREMLERGRERVRTELAGQPDVVAEMLRVIGRSYQNLGLFDEATAAYEEGLSMRERSYGINDVQVAGFLAAIGGVSNDRGDYPKAEELGRRAVAIARDIGPRADPALAEALNVLGAAVNFHGRFEEAETFYRESIEVFKRVKGPRSMEVSAIMNNLALLLHERSRYEDAEELFKEALSIQEELFGARHPETATTRYNYAQLLADTGRLEQARAAWDEVLATDRALYPDGHPNIAFTLSAYARMLSRLGEFERAEALEREALAIRRSFHGDTNPDVAYSMGSLGRLLMERARYDEAEVMLRGALAMHIETNGSDHPIVGAVMNDVGKLLYERGDYTAAEKMHREALAFLREASGDEDRNAVAVSMVRLANDLAAQGRLVEADSLARGGLALTRRLHDDRGPWAAGGFVDLANIQFQMGAVEEAESLFAEGLKRWRAMESGGPARPRDVRALLGLGRCRLANGDVAGAEKYFREALEIEQRYRRPDHPAVARAQAALAEARAAGAAPSSR